MSHLTQWADDTNLDIPSAEIQIRLDRHISTIRERHALEVWYRSEIRRLCRTTGTRNETRLSSYGYMMDRPVLR